jgi:C1A family cysteine protease
MLKETLVSFLSAALLPASAPMGLQWATPEQLRAVPLASMPYSGSELPLQVDLSEHMPPPGDQGRQNSCVGWATAYALKSYQEHIEQNIALAKADGSPDWARVFSPAFVYNLLNNGRDGGITYIDALNLLSNQGTVSWSEMPYNPDDYRSKPSSSLQLRARPWRIDYWRQINVLDHKEIKAHLNAGFPVMVGALIDEGFYKAKRGHIWKNSRGKQMGGHAFVLVGFDERKQAFKLINSWGSNWADGGFGWIDYAWFPRVVREGFVAKDAINGLPLTGLRALSTAPANSFGAQPQDEDRLKRIVQEEEQSVDARKQERPTESDSQPKFKPNSNLGIIKIAKQKTDLKLEGQFHLPALRAKKTALVLEIYARKDKQRQALLKNLELFDWDESQYQKRLSQPLFNWQKTISKTNLGLENHPLAGSTQALELEIVPVLFVDGFGIYQEAPLIVTLSSAESPVPILTQTQTHAMFWQAWASHNDRKLWQMLSPQAQKKVLALFKQNLIQTKFSETQLQNLLAVGHPLARQLLWQSLTPPRSSNAGEAKPAPVVSEAKKNETILILRQYQGSWKIDSLPGLLLN